MIRRRTALSLPWSLALPGALPAVLPVAAGLSSLSAQAQTPKPGRKDSLVLAMTLEPPGLDPTAGAAAAIGEVVHYNVLETLTKIRADSSIGPLLAHRWTVTPDNKTWAFHLRSGVKFHNGEPFNAATVKYAFERAAAEGAPNKEIGRAHV